MGPRLVGYMSVVAVEEIRPKPITTIKAKIKTKIYVRQQSNIFVFVILFSYAQMTQVVNSVSLGNKEPFVLCSQ